MRRIYWSCLLLSFVGVALTIEAGRIDSWGIGIAGLALYVVAGTFAVGAIAINNPTDEWLNNVQGPHALVLFAGLALSIASQIWGWGNVSWSGIGLFLLGAAPIVTAHTEEQERKQRRQKADEERKQQELLDALRRR